MIQWTTFPNIGWTTVLLTLIACKQWGGKFALPVRETSSIKRKRASDGCSLHKVELLTLGVFFSLLHSTSLLKKNDFRTFILRFRAFFFSFLFFRNFFAFFFSRWVLLGRSVIEKREMNCYGLALSFSFPLLQFASFSRFCLRRNFLKLSWFLSFWASWTLKDGENLTLALLICLQGCLLPVRFHSRSSITKKQSVRLTYSPFLSPCASQYRLEADREKGKSYPSCYAVSLDVYSILTQENIIVSFFVIIIILSISRRILTAVVIFLATHTALGASLQTTNTAQ